MSSTNAVITLNTQLPQMTKEQLDLITKTIAKDATPDELKLFLYRCQNLGLDPLKPGQIHFVKYGNSAGTIVVGIEGFRAIAGRTGQLSGVERGVTRDANGKAVAGWAKVFRKDWTHPAHEEVPMAEYNTGKGPWAKMPETMIKKVAEAAALRMAFPDHVGGIYAPEEMDQAGEPVGGRVVDPIENETNLVEPTKYLIPFGQWKNRSLEEVYKNAGPEKMASYLTYLEDSAKKKGQALSPPVIEFIERVEDFLGAMEAQKDDAGL